MFWENLEELFHDNICSKPSATPYCVTRPQSVKDYDVIYIWVPSEGSLSKKHEKIYKATTG